MRTLTFYGISDDLFEIKGTKGSEPDERNEGTVMVRDENGEGCLVTASHTSNGCWMIGVTPLDGDIEIPEWNLRLKLGGRGYSTELTMDVPDTVVVSNYDEG